MARSQAHDPERTPEGSGSDVEAELHAIASPGDMDCPHAAAAGPTLRSMTKQVREALAVLCIAAALAVLGVAVGDRGGRILLSIAMIGAVLALVMLAVELVRGP